MAFIDQKSLPLDRRQAGQLLAKELTEYVGRKELVVLALPCGGVCVGIEIARQLQAPLAAILVAKLTFPGTQGGAIGAVTNGGLRYINRTVTRELGITDEAIETAIHRAATELLLRERTYSQGPALPDLKEKIVILADDGMISGSTMYLACCAVRRAGAREVIVAVPVVSRTTREKLAQVANRLVSLVELREWEPLNGWYFAQRPTDRQAAKMLDEFVAQSNPDPVTGKDTEQELVRA